MGKKRRTRRSDKRNLYTLTIVVFSLTTLIFLPSHLSRILNVPSQPTRRVGPHHHAPSAQLDAPAETPPEKPRRWFQLTASTTPTEQSKPASTEQSKPTSTSTEQSEPASTEQSKPASTEQSKPALAEQTKPAFSWFTRSATPPTAAVIPKGPYPFPPLNQSESNSNGSTPHEGTTWAASLARGVMNSLPLHWLAELTHAAPKEKEEPQTSIFSARRKGQWLGCAREAHLVCKGVYRAIKRTNAVTVVDTSCGANSNWLPHVIRKLRGEFRHVRLTCLGEWVAGYGKKVAFREIDPYEGALPNGTDLVIAYKLVERGTLISAMKFFKNVKRAGAKFLVTENFPDEENAMQQVNGRTRLRLNAAMAPFWFPAPEYEYENDEENVEGVAMQIAVSRVGELFEEKVTPGMEDLVDPRRRVVRE